MKIISLDQDERKGNTPGWRNLDARITQINNTHNLSFKCDKNLAISQHKHNEKCSTNIYQNVCILYMPFVDNYCHNIIDLLPELLHLEEVAKYDLILSAHSDITDNFIDVFNIKINCLK